MPNGESEGKRVLSVPVVVVISSVGLGASGLAWLFDKTGDLELEITRNADRVTAIRREGAIRAEYSAGFREKVVAMLEEVRQQQQVIRDTQALIRSTQKDIRAAQIQIIREIEGSNPPALRYRLPNNP